MIFLAVLFLSSLNEIGLRIEKRIDPHPKLTTRYDTFDIDTEIMRRLQRIGSGKNFIKSDDIQPTILQISKDPQLPSYN